MFALGSVLAFALTGTPPFGEGRSEAVLYRIIHHPSPAVAGGTVHIASNDHNLYALDAATGQIRWTQATGSHADSSPAVSDGTVYLGSWDHKLYALDAATGRIRWTHTTGGFVESSPAVAGGTVYVGSDDDKVYALDAATGS